MWGGGGAKLGCVAFRGPGPWLPGPLFRPASWSISRARTFTAVAIARTSREVAPMVSWPAEEGVAILGAPRLAGVFGGRGCPTRAGRLEGPTAAGVPVWPLSLGGSAERSCLGRAAAVNLKRTSADSAGKFLGVYSHRCSDMRNSDCLSVPQSVETDVHHQQETGK